MRITNGDSKISKSEFNIEVVRQKPEGRPEGSQSQNENQSLSLPGSDAMIQINRESK
jgi:hypothetical protein